MAGPIASLLLREPLSDSQIAKQDSWLRQIGEITILYKDERERYSADFSITNFPPLVTKPEEKSCTFLLSLRNPEKDGDVSFGDYQKEVIQANLGYVPQEIILVSAMCNQKKDHQLLAQVLIKLAA